MVEELTQFDMNDKLKIQVAVPLNILESYYRRKTQKVVGTLLGVVYPSHIEITNCYPVPLTEIENDDEDNYEIAIDTEHHVMMHKLNQQVHLKEIVVGYYLTNSDIDMNVVMLNTYYSQKDSFFISQGLLQQPIFLTLDPNCKNSSFNLKTYQSIPQPILNDSFSIFQEIPFQIDLLDFKKDQIQPILQYKKDQQQNSYNFSQILNEISQNIKQIQKIITNKKESPELNDLLKKLCCILNGLPKVRKDELKQIKNILQDVMLVNYLTNFAKSQTVISEKLTKI